LSQISLAFICSVKPPIERSLSASPKHHTGCALTFNASDCIRIDRLCRSGGEFAALCRKHDPNFKKEAKPLF